MRACWCGVKNPHYSEDGLEASCGGTGVVQCFCGGDQCVCHHHGETECDGCEDCADPDDEFESLEDF